ncbi:MAG: SPFH domain-containing protein, partial [Patescibacteria group bacterium]
MASWIFKGQLEVDLIRLAEKMSFWRRRNHSPGRFRMMWRRMLDSFTGGVGWLWRRKNGRKRRKEKKEEKKTSFRAGWVLFFLILFGVLGLMQFDFWWGLMLLAGDLIYLGTCLHEVRDPGFAYLRRMGKRIADLPAGWYLTVPHFWDIEYRSAAKIVLELGDPTTGMGMYLARGTPINVKARIIYHLTDPAKAFLISEEDFQRKIVASALAKLRAAIGKRFFTGEKDSLLAEKEDIEGEILEAVNKEAQNDGHTVDGIEIYDFDEAVLSKARSEAAFISEVGMAEARVRGAKVKAVTDNLKNLQDNWPGAVALGLAAGSLVGETKVRGAEEAPRGEKPAEEKKSEVGEKVSGVIEYLR